MRNLTK